MRGHVPFLPNPCLFLVNTTFATAPTMCMGPAAFRSNPDVQVLTQNRFTNEPNYQTTVVPNAVRAYSQASSIFTNSVVRAYNTGALTIFRAVYHTTAFEASSSIARSCVSLDLSFCSASLTFTFVSLRVPTSSQCGECRCRCLLLTEMSSVATTYKTEVTRSKIQM